MSDKPLTIGRLNASFPVVDSAGNPTTGLVMTLNSAFAEIEKAIADIRAVVAELEAKIDQP